TWILTQMSGHSAAEKSLLLASWIPLILTAIAWLFCKQRIVSMWDVVPYMKELEQRFALDGLGWQAYLNKVYSGKPQRRFGVSFLPNLIFLMQMVLSIYLSYILCHIAGFRNLMRANTGKDPMPRAWISDYEWFDVRRENGEATLVVHC